MLYSLNAEGTRRLARFLLEDCCHLRPELVGTDEEAEAQADALMQAS